MFPAHDETYPGRCARPMVGPTVRDMRMNESSDDMKPVLVKRMQSGRHEAVDMKTHFQPTSLFTSEENDHIQNHWNLLRVQ